MKQRDEEQNIELRNEMTNSKARLRTCSRRIGKETIKISQKKLKMDTKVLTLRITEFRERKK